MIGKVLAFLRTRLNEHVRDELAQGVDDPVADKVVFIQGDEMDRLKFHDEAISELLIHVEEDRVLRAADPYVRTGEDRKPQRQQPDLRLVLYVLFAARFKQYDAAWDSLSTVIEYLQTNRTFERTTHPTLPAGVDRLNVELVTQSFAELSHVWSVLRTSHHPSVLYRVRMVILRDTQPVARGQIPELVVVDVHGVS